MSEQASPTAVGQQPSKVIYVETENERPEFDVEFYVGEWWFRRIVRITDPSVDLAGVARRIARGETGITVPDRPDGDLFMPDGSGRQYLVGDWYTFESDAHGHDVVNDLRFAFGRGETYDAEGLEGATLVPVFVDWPGADAIHRALSLALGRRVAGADWERALSEVDLLDPRPAPDWAERKDWDRVDLLLGWLRSDRTAVPEEDAALMARAIGARTWSGTYADAAAALTDCLAIADAPEPPSPPVTPAPKTQGSPAGSGVGPALAPAGPDTGVQAEPRLHSEGEPRTVRLEKCGSSQLLFGVRVDYHGAYSERNVWVWDPTVNIPELLRRIARDETWVTRFDQPEGDLTLPDGDREYVIGRWETVDMHQTEEAIVGMTFVFDGDVRVAREEVDHLLVDVERASRRTSSPAADPNAGQRRDTRTGARTEQ